MTIYQIIACVIFFGMMLISAIALLIHWVLFNKDYWTSLARYKELINGTPIEDLDDLYNKEFPTDYSLKEIKEWAKGETDDTKDA